MKFKTKETFFSSHNWSLIRGNEGIFSYQFLTISPINFSMYEYPKIRLNLYFFFFFDENNSISFFEQLNIESNQQFMRRYDFCRRSSEYVT